MIAAKTELIRARVSQEVRVILPPCGQRVMYDPSLPCRGEFTPADRELLKAAHFDSEEELREGGEVFTGPLQNYVRCVQLLVPPSPKIVFGLDILPVTLGPNRGNYKLPPLAAGTTIKLELLPEQFLVAAADVGTGLLGIIVEYHHRSFEA
jgi:hypothetical protein